MVTTINNINYKYNYADKFCLQQALKSFEKCSEDLNQLKKQALTFKQCYQQLGGYNFYENELFDINLPHVTVTVDYNYGDFCLMDSLEVWNDRTGEMYNYYTLNDIKNIISSIEYDFATGWTIEQLHEVQKQLKNNTYIDKGYDTFFVDLYYNDNYSGYIQADESINSLIYKLEVYDSENNEMVDEFIEPLDLNELSDEEGLITFMLDKTEKYIEYIEKQDNQLIKAIKKYNSKKVHQIKGQSLKQKDIEY